MTKRLVGFYRPPVSGDMTEEEKKEAREDLVRTMVKDIAKASGSMLQGLSEEELDASINEGLKGYESLSESQKDDGDISESLREDDETEL